MANYRITAEDNIAAGGAKTKAKQNIAAIKILKAIELEQRQATAEEQAQLVSYSGWGAAPDIFTGKTEWAKLQDELKDLLSEKEFEAARSSTLNAHYTTPAIVSEIYAGLEQLGFNGGRILDPSMGASGIFEGVMPEATAQASDITGIELDSISGRIATYLYPDSTIHVNGFQDVELPNDYFDLSISNVPFSQIGVVDPKYKGLPVDTLHDYFFAKGIDKVRPGGLLAYVTSTGTMQSRRGEKFREYLAERANLVGAVRLPGDAFKQIAGTEVTTDIVILQKLGDEVEPNEVSWTKLIPTSVLGVDGQALVTNEYFANNPHMMLGTLTDDKLYPGRLALKGDGRAIEEAIKQAFEQIPSDIYEKKSTIDTEEEQEEKTLIPPELQSTLKQNAFTLYEDQLLIRRGGWLYPENLTGKKLERAIGLISIREATESVLNVQLQNGTEEALTVAQAKLNKVYDAFVRENGCISRQANKAVFKEDPSFPLLLALESYDRESQTATKSDIFSKRTIQPHIRKESAETAKEGLLHSLNELGRVDIGYIAKLIDKSRIEAVSELQQDSLIFLDPDTDQWQTQDEYLSGNVRQKLEDAIAAAEAGDPQFSGNIEALKAVQPELIPPGDIDVRLGATWIPPEEVSVFVSELLKVSNDKISIRHSKDADAWYVGASASVSGAVANTKVYGSSRRTAIKLIETALNLKTPIVYDYDRDGSRSLNIEDTAAAKLKFEEIRERFKGWMWSDPARTERLTTLYNEKFNTHRERQFDGAHLELPGKNPNITFRPHQKNAVWRSLSGNTLFAHAVGAGKTYSMIAAAMEQKRLGLAQKPIIVVPNHLLEQIAADCKLLYPASNLLAATKKDASKQNRQQLMSRIATGNWDIVLVTHTAFEKLRLSDEKQTSFYQEAFNEVEDAIRGASNYGDDSRRLMKDLERRKESLKNKIKEIADNPAKDNTVSFEQLGIDLVIVDESHYFKNLGYTTKMRNVAGLPNTNSNRAFDMFMKTRYISEVRGDEKGVIFSTGTPISNSMAELYTIQRYLQPETLKVAGVSSFDDWASVFGDTVTAPELSPTGEFKVKTRFAQFVNMPELMTLCRQVMDVQTADMLNLPVPEIAGGKPTIVAVPATDNQLLYMEQLVERAKNMSWEDRALDNMLKITGDGRKMSATMKLFDPELPDEPDSKLSRLVDDTAKFWHEYKEEKTHLIFCDLGTPKTTGKFSIYQYVKEQCIEKGVPAEKIAFAQDANSDAQKLALQKDFNAGKIAVLIAGASLETGFNGQRRLGRVSHFTVPWRPDQIEQRDGRGLRQGNRNKEIEIFRYTTQGRNGQIGIDGYLWKTLKTKKMFADQAMKGSTTQRKMSDISSDALSYSELEGIATGNPLIMEKATIDNDIAQLSSQKRAHTNNTYRKRKALDEIPDKIRSTQKMIAQLTQDLASAKSAIKAGSVTLWGEQLQLDDVEEIGKRVRSRADLINKMDEAVTEPIGQLGTLSLAIHNNGHTTGLVLQGVRTHRVAHIIQSKQGAYDAIAGIDNRLTKSISNHSKDLERQQADQATLLADPDKPFAGEAELRAALKRQAEIYIELDAIGKKSSAKDTLRVAAGEEQPDETTRRIARFLERADIHSEVMSAEGFKVTLKEAETLVPVTVDASDGTSIKIRSEVSIPPSVTAKDITATFSISGDGILAVQETPDTDEGRSQDKETAQLAHYLAGNVFTTGVQALNANEAFTPESAGDVPEIKTTGSGDGNASTAGQRPVASSDVQKDKICKYTANLLSKLDLRSEVVSGDSFRSEVADARNGNRVKIETEQTDDATQLKIVANVRQGDSEPAYITAIFSVDKTGMLLAKSVTAEGEEKSSLTSTLRFNQYLKTAQFTVEKFPEKEPTANKVLADSTPPMRGSNQQNSGNAKHSEDRVCDYTAAILLDQGLQPAVISGDTFYLEVTDTRSNTTSIAAEKTADGTRLKMISDISDSGAPPSHITVIFSADESGKLTAESVASENINLPVNVNTLRLASYMEKAQFALQTGLSDGTLVQKAVADRALNIKSSIRVDSPTNEPPVEVRSPLDQAKEIVFELQSLHSGRKEELRLPANNYDKNIATQGIQDKQPQREEAAAKKTGDPALETVIYKTETIAVTRNPEQAGIEIRFTEKPSSEWTDRLGKKGQQFRFSKKGSDARWYRKESRVSLPAVLQIAKQYHAAQIAEPVATADAVQPSNPIEPTDKQADVTSNEESKLAPAFEQHLKLKAQYPDALVIVQSPIGGQYELFGTDAGVAAKKLGLTPGRMKSGSNQHGQVPVTRIFAKDSIEDLQEVARVALLANEGDVQLYPKIEPANTLADSQNEGAAQVNDGRIQPVDAHHRRVDRAMANFIKMAGLSSAAMTQPVHITVRNGELQPLWIDAYNVEGDRSITATQYNQLAGGTQQINASMKFSVSEEGMLSLKSTAFYIADTGKVVTNEQGGDLRLATLHIRSLRRQEFGKAVLAELQASGPEAREPIQVQHRQATESLVSDHAKESTQLDVTETAQDSAQLEESTQADEPVDTASAAGFFQMAIEEHDPQLAFAFTESEEPTHAKVSQLRDWYISARAQQKTPEVVDNIKEKGLAAAGEDGSAKLTQTEATDMNADLQWLAEHSVEPKAVSIDDLREWHRANTLISGANYTGRIEEIAGTFKLYDTNKVRLEKSDYQRMTSDVRALRSHLSEGISDIWQAVIAKNIATTTSEGLSYAGNQYEISCSSDGHLLRLKNQTNNCCFVMHEGKVVTNTLSNSDISMLKLVENASEPLAVKQTKEVQR